MAQTQSSDLSNNLKKSESSMRLLTKLGNLFKTQMSQATQSIHKWLSLDSAAKKLISQTEKVISDLKEIDTLMKSISRTDRSLSKSELAKIANNSFETASKYGKTAAEYLADIQAASHAGYKNSAGIAELSAAAQAAGDMTAELANQYIAATDQAYQFGGSIEKLTQVLDGSHSIANRHAIDMADLAEAMSIAGSQAAALGIGADETAAALGTMIATTNQSGAEMAEAFNVILLSLKQVADEEAGFDAEGLIRYRKACEALNVSLKETRSGVTTLREPMEILKDLSKEYAKLDSNDSRRADLLNAVGGGANADALNAILDNYDMYSKMLDEYAHGTGSIAAEAERTANSWESSLNRLSNTWTDAIRNIVESEGVLAAINGLNSLLSIVNYITAALGSLGVGITSIIGKGRSNTILPCRVVTPYSKP